MGFKLSNLNPVKIVHNIAEGVKDIPGSAKGFVNNPLQSTEKGLGSVVNTMSLGSMGADNRQTAGGAVLGLGTGELAAGALAGKSAATGAGPATSPDYLGSGTDFYGGTGAAPDVFSGSGLGGVGSTLGTAASSFADFVKSYGPTLAQLGIGGAGIYEAYKQNQAANNALDAQTAAQNNSLKLQEEQLAAAKDLGQQSIDLSKQEYQNRLDIGKRIEDNANLDPSYINSEASKAGVTAEQGFANQLEQEKRGLSRMGVDPTSGRYAGDMRAENLGAAAAKVGAINNTRTGLVNYARDLKNQALAAELGISNPAIETTGQQSQQATQVANQEANTGLAYSGIYGNQANQSSANAQDALNSGLSAFSTIMDRNNKAA